MPMRKLPKAAIMALPLLLACCQSRTPVPAYRVMSARDADFTSQGAVIRRQIEDVKLPTVYSEKKVLAVAKDVVATETREEAVNAIMIFFYGPNTVPGGGFDVARVVWAPGGKGEDANSVRAGDYGTFRYSLNYISPEQTPPSLLVLSSKKAIYGIPLPKGAKLITKFRGSRSPVYGKDHVGGSEGRRIVGWSVSDPYEKYRIRASATEITGFYEREMKLAGWKQYGPSSLHSYKKGKIQVIILVGEKGGTFKIMGS